MSSRVIKRIISVYMALLIILCPLVISNGAEKEKATEPQNIKSHDIAVVFDNTDTMYKGTDTWCRTKYALSLMASLLNFNAGDRMTIYPMWEVSTSKQISEENKGSYGPIGIGSVSSLETIEFMYTTGTGKGTPYEPIDEAFNALSTSNADEKWLVVISASQFNMQTRTDESTSPISKDEIYNKIISKNESMANTVKVQYISVGKGINEESDLSSYSNGNTFFASWAKNSADIQNEIVNAAKVILGLSELDSKSFEKGTLSLDVSMNNVYVIADGKDNSFTNLSNPDGEQLKASSDSKQIKYSVANYSHVNYKKGSDKAVVDRDLKGRVCRFDNLEIGKYKLTFSGVIRILYNPNIAIRVKIASDSKGDNVIKFKNTNNKSLEADIYYIFYSVIDRQTLSKVDSNALINVSEYSCALTPLVDNTKGKPITITKNGSSFSIGANETMYVAITATYGDSIKISTTDYQKYYTYTGTASNKLRISVETESNYYAKIFKGSWKPIKLNVTMGGKPVDASIFDSLKLSAAFSGDVKYTYEVDANNSCYYVYLGKTSDGSIVAPANSRYNAEFKVSVTDENLKIENSQKATYSFDVDTLPDWFATVILIVFIAVLVIVLIIIERKKIKKLFKLIKVKIDDSFLGKFTKKKKKKKVKIKFNNIK